MRRGTIVLTPFPFTDLGGRKVRPALTVSRSDRPGNDVILAFITRFQGDPVLTTNLLIEDLHPSFAQTGLKVSSVIKLDKLVTIEGSILLGELGDLPASVMQQVDDRLRYALDLV